MYTYNNNRPNFVSRFFLFKLIVTYTYVCSDITFDMTSIIYNYG